MIQQQRAYLSLARRSSGLQCSQAIVFTRVDGRSMSKDKLTQVREAKSCSDRQWRERPSITTEERNEPPIAYWVQPIGVGASTEQRLAKWHIPLEDCSLKHSRIQHCHRQVVNALDWRNKRVARGRRRHERLGHGERGGGRSVATRKHMFSLVVPRVIAFCDSVIVFCDSAMAKFGGLSVVYL